MVKFRLSKFYAIPAPIITSDFLEDLCGRSSHRLLYMHLKGLLCVPDLIGKIEDLFTMNYVGIIGGGSRATISKIHVDHQGRISTSQSSWTVSCFSYPELNLLMPGRDYGHDQNVQNSREESSKCQIVYEDVMLREKLTLNKDALNDYKSFSNLELEHNGFELEGNDDEVVEEEIAEKIWMEN
ncbi:hypothetical protein ACH5RR_007368 [Cinchona calisaya]|uniref:Uncharacterized protein n=1 Tax=Cinchona calisaya TaxID=153742 RepID=A0ABD3AS34_9GENT